MAALRTERDALERAEQTILKDKIAALKSKNGGIQESIFVSPTITQLVTRITDAIEQVEREMGELRAKMAKEIEAEMQSRRKAEEDRLTNEIRALQKQLDEKVFRDHLCCPIV